MGESFWGRESELADLKRIDSQKKAALIVCLGRRRIGKSRLIQEFGKKIPHYIEIQGLAPRPGQTNQDQLDWFSREIARQTQLPEVFFKDWADVFQILSAQLEDKHVLIFLDEISWMGHHDPDFPGKLKVAWDLHFKKNPRLRLVLCGSVSSWISKNILKSTDFIGRISLEIVLRDLSLKDAHKFWQKKASRISDLEKLRILCLTGGVPRYLEEVDYSRSVEENYKNLCFTRSGFLFSEFERIFNDIFERRSDSYKKIIQSLIHGPKSLTEISKMTKLPANGVLTHYLSDLELSGFIHKEVLWDLKKLQNKNKNIRYRLYDNYVRFYLKYILPNSARIEKGLFKEIGVDKLAAFDTFVGLQFENLILQNLPVVCQLLKIPLSSVLNAGSYFQTSTARQQACQIDLLIQTKNSLYLCELKARREIEDSVVDEVKEKIKKLKRPAELSVRPVLIYAGGLHPGIEESEYFDATIALKEFLD